MPTTRSDVVVLGSTLGGLVAAVYLARARLRVILIEEDVHRKRPPLLREPFLLSGLETGGPIRRVLRDLALPLIERREIQRTALALQVVLPKHWIDVSRGVAGLASELADQGLIELPEARAWLESLDVEWARTRARLWDGPALDRAQRPWLGRGYEPATTVSFEHSRPPTALEAFSKAQLEALCTLAPPHAAPPMLLRTQGEGGFRMPHAEATFLSLFRRRLPTLHGEIRSVSGFALEQRRREFAIQLDRETIQASALVIAVPLDPLRRFLAESGPPPAWLPAAVPPIETPARLFRIERAARPCGMADRVIQAGSGDPTRIHWFSWIPDPHDIDSSWLVAAGPGASELPARKPLGDLAPFSGGQAVEIDPGPVPRWDRDGGELRFREAEQPARLHSRPPVVQVGPERIPALGFEGEVLIARRTALQLAERLGRRRRMA